MSAIFLTVLIEIRCSTEDKTRVKYFFLSSATTTPQLDKCKAFLIYTSNRSLSSKETNQPQNGFFVDFSGSLVGFSGAKYVLLLFIQWKLPALCFVIYSGILKSRTRCAFVKTHNGPLESE